MPTLIPNGLLRIGEEALRIGAPVTGALGRAIAGNIAWLTASYFGRNPDGPGYPAPPSTGRFNHTGLDLQDRPTGAFLRRADTMFRGVFRDIDDLAAPVEIEGADWQAVPLLYPALRFYSAVAGRSHTLHIDAIPIWPDIYTPQIRLWTGASADSGSEMKMRLSLYSDRDRNDCIARGESEEGGLVLVSGTDWRVIDLSLDMQSDIERRKAWREYAADTAAPLWLSLEARIANADGSGYIKDDPLTPSGQAYTLPGLSLGTI